MIRTITLSPAVLARAAVAALTAFVVGCDRPRVSHYVVPADDAPPSTSSDGTTTPFQPPPVTVKWDTLPAGWEVAPGTRASAAAFRIPGPGGTEGGITATPLPALAGREADLINIYRQMAALPPLSEAEALALLEPVSIAGREGRIFDILGTMPSENSEQKIVTAIAHEADASWFFRLSGPPALVDAQRNAFVDFLKTLTFATAAPPPAPATSAGGNFNWSVPPAWTAVAPGAMQAAKFAVPAVDGVRAEVSVSIFPSDTGGTQANVDRWRGQIGLDPVEPAQLKDIALPLDPALPGAILMDLKKDQTQLIGAIVPRRGRWYFYKLLGDAAAVAPQKDAFVAFVKSEP